MKRKGMMEGMIIILSILVIFIAFSIFSFFALNLSVKQTHYNIQEVNVLSSPVFLENYLNTPVKDQKMADLIVEYYYTQYTKQSIEQTTEEILAKLNYDQNYKLTIGNLEIISHGFNTKFKKENVVYNESTFLPPRYSPKMDSIKFEIMVIK